MPREKILVGGTLLVFVVASIVGVAMAIGLEWAQRLAFLVAVVMVVLVWLVSTVVLRREIRQTKAQLTQLIKSENSMNRSTSISEVRMMAEAAQRIEKSAAELSSQVLQEDKAVLTQLRNRLAKDIREQHRVLSADLIAQQEAFSQLYRSLPSIVETDFALPPTGGWAMTADSLLEVRDIIRAKKPKVVLELGSGTSTAWLGAEVGSTVHQYVSIDHSPEYFAKTQSMLQRLGLGSKVDLRLAPLREYASEHGSYKWYDGQSFADIKSIDLLIIDGPPAATGPNARRPAIEHLASRLSENAIIVIDDAQRIEESELVDEWLDQFDDMTRAPVQSERIIVLQRGSFL